MSVSSSGISSSSSTSSSYSSSKKTSSSSKSSSKTLTAAEVAQYLQTNAFATKRTTAANRVVPESSKTTNVPTKDITETLKLLNGSSKNLDTVLLNLQEMQKTAASITDRSSASERQTAYAKLRSLSSGIDQVLTSTTFNKQQLFDGSQLDLASAGQYSHMLLDDLSTTNKKGLNLATDSSGAAVGISYDDFCSWNNAMVHLSGLNITNARGSDVDPAADELATGDYSVEVDYAGSKSSVIIKNTDGTELSRQDNVDLSGSGVTTVRFDCGVALDFDKTQVKGSTVDKYDYENKGPAVLYANLNYQRVDTYNLTGSKAATERSATADVTGAPVTDSRGNTVGIGGVSLGAVAKTSTELKNGTYSVEVYKVGDYASAVMYDSTGNVVGGLSDIALDKKGSTSLDFGNGCVVSVKNDGHIGNAVLKTTVQYSRAVNAYDGFDFSKYSKKIQGAIDTVTEQQKTIDKAAGLVTNVQSAVNGTLSSNVHSTSSLLIKNLLGGSVTSTSATGLLSGASSSNSGLEWASNMITSNLSTALGLSNKRGTTLTSLLSGNVTSLNPVTLPTKIAVHSS